MPAPIICDKCQEFLNKPARLFMSEEEFKSSRHYGGSDVLIGDAHANIAVWIGKNNVGRSKSSWWYCAPIHPRCTHLYEEFTPKMKSIYSQDEDELDEIFGEGMEEFTHNQMKNTHNDKGEQFWTAQKSSLVLWHEDDCSCHADEELDPGEWIESYLSV